MHSLSVNSRIDTTTNILRFDYVSRLLCEHKEIQAENTRRERPLVRLTPSDSASRAEPELKLIRSLFRHARRRGIPCLVLFASSVHRRVLERGSLTFPDSRRAIGYRIEAHDVTIRVQRPSEEDLQTGGLSIRPGRRPIHSVQRIGNRDRSGNPRVKTRRRIRVRSASPSQSCPRPYPPSPRNPFYGVSFDPSAPVNLTNYVPKGETENLVGSRCGNSVAHSVKRYMHVHARIIPAPNHLPPPSSRFFPPPDSPQKTGTPGEGVRRRGGGGGGVRRGPLRARHRVLY